MSLYKIQIYKANLNSFSNQCSNSVSKVLQNLLYHFVFFHIHQISFYTGTLWHSDDARRALRHFKHSSTWKIRTLWHLKTWGTWALRYLRHLRKSSNQAIGHFRHFVSLTQSSEGTDLFSNIRIFVLVHTLCDTFVFIGPQLLV